LAKVLIVLPFAELFSKSVWYPSQVIMGAIVATRKRTVTSILGVMGLTQEKNFQNYHRVLNRAKWSSLAASCTLVKMLVTIFEPEQPMG
jgi:DDE superfamily endonuclease